MAGGNFGGGDGNAVTPYLVEDAADLNAVRNGLGKAYKQVANINLSAYPNWVPIGDSSSRFSGVYSGNGFSISNLNISTTTQYVGLFGLVSGLLTGISVVSGTIQIKPGNHSIGAVVGSSSGETEYCSNQGVLFDEPVKVSFTYLGGVAGRSTRIGHCYNTANLSIKGNLNGVVGYGICSSCHNTGNLTSLEGSAVGVVFSGSQNVTDCYNTGNLEAYSSCVGVSYTGNDNHRCYNTGSLVSTVGVTHGVTDGVAYDCYNTGNQRAGGVAYGISRSICYRSYNSGNMFAEDGAYGITNVNAYECYALMDSITRIQGGSNTTNWHKVTATSRTARNCYALDSMVLIYE